jgi:hypothetical protein
LIVVSVTVAILLALSLSAYVAPASAGAILSEPLCGNGSASDYGFTYTLKGLTNA